MNIRTQTTSNWRGLGGVGLVKLGWGGTGAFLEGRERQSIL